VLTVQGQRSLSDSLVGSSVKTSVVKEMQEEEEDIHVPEEIEEVVGLLF